MNFETYLHLFEKIVAYPDPQPPYDNPDYMDYTRLNHARMKRWMNTAQLDEELVQLIKSKSESQHWIIIVEPWCGDVAPSLPFILKLAEQNPQFAYDLQLRDSEPFLINSYLTRGTKSIPKLIVRNETGNDLFTWGPRPAEAQQLMEKLKAENADFATMKIELQNWYNNDKGKSLQAELKELLRTDV